jgi:hypothetical protein
MAGTLRSALHPQRSRLILSAGLALSWLTRFPSAFCATCAWGDRNSPRRTSASRGSGASSSQEASGLLPFFAPNRRDVYMALRLQ